MKISKAAALIRTPLIEWARPQSWCDLGCGSGTFTTALAHLLAAASTIHAVDLDRRALESVPDYYDGVEIPKTPGGYRKPQLPPSAGRWHSHGKFAALHSRAAGIPEKVFACDRSFFDRGI